MSENELVPQDARQMLTAALSHLGNITGLTVRTDEELTAANSLAAQLKQCAKELVDKRQELVKPYKEKANAIEIEFRDALKKLDNGISKIGQGVGAYWAQKQAAIDAENARLAAEAEAKRRKEEEKAAEERRKAEAFAAQGKTALAAKAEARAEVAVEKAVSIVAPTVAAPKLAGTSMLEYYEGEVIDKALAVDQLLKSPFAHVVTIDMAILNKAQDQAKGTMQIAGVRFTKKFRARHTGR
jgi:hypothetical protein